MRRVSKISLYTPFLALGFFIVACNGSNEAAVTTSEITSATEWPDYGGKDALHFAALDEITPDNVKHLAKVWEYKTGDIANDRPPYGTTSAFELTPLLMDETLYLCTPFNRVIALNPATGEEI